MMAVYVGPELAPMVYGELKTYAQAWLERMGFKSELTFRLCLASRPFHLQRFPEGIVLVTDWVHGVRAQVHPLFKEKRAYFDPELLDAYLTQIAEDLGVHRLEFRVYTPVGPGLRRLLERVGAEYEGTLRRSEIAWSNNVPSLIDVESWAILYKDLGGDHGLEL